MGKRTHCVNGHLRTPENITPSRGCREYHNAQRRAKRAANCPDRSVRPCGHANTPENTYYRSDGSAKGCRPCALERERRRNEAKAAAEGRAIHRPDPEWFPCGHPRTPENARPKNGTCKTCHRESQIRRYHADPERHKRAASDYQKANRAARSAYHKQWRHVNVEAYRAYRRAIQRARQLASRDSETLDYINIIGHDACVYCGAPAETVDHIEASRHGGSNHWTNYAPACKSCNCGKRDKSLLVFLMRHPVGDPVTRPKAAA
jgi:hypothetical protein